MTHPGAKMAADKLLFRTTDIAYKNERKIDKTILNFMIYHLSPFMTGPVYMKTFTKLKKV